MKKCLLAAMLTILLAAELLPGAAIAAAVNLDTSDTANGVITVNVASPQSKRLKLRVTKGKTTLTYDLDSSGKAEVFPLQLGDGKYTVTVFKNVSGTSYAQLYTTTLDVKLSDPNAPFLRPNQRVNYNDDTEAVKVAKKLCKDLDTDVEMIDAIYSYVIKNYTYDYDKADRAIAGKLTGYVPDLDEIFESKSGICYDYASMMAAMLRSVGIPAKLVMGYVAPNSMYHAWNEIYIEGQGWVVKKVYFSGEEWKLMDATFASSSNNSDKINSFIRKVQNYVSSTVY